MAESQRTQWLLSMPACSTVNATMQKRTEADYMTSDQHKDDTAARQSRDDKATRCLLDYLQHRNPWSVTTHGRALPQGSLLTVL